MDVDAMGELMYDTLIRYFKTLAHTGYKSYNVVFKMLVMDFIYEITHTELRYYITNKDIKLMQDLLYQFFGSTCEISFPTNNRPCCICVCCNEGSSTPPPVVPGTTTTTTSSTTTSTRPPSVYTYLTLTSNTATRAYVNGVLCSINIPIEVEVGSVITVTALNESGYNFEGFYDSEVLLHDGNTLNYMMPSTGAVIELRYSRRDVSSTTSTLPPSNIATIQFSNNTYTNYTVTYSNNSTLYVGTYDEIVTLNFPSDVDSIQFIINSIECENSNYKCTGTSQGDLPCTISVRAGQNIVVTPYIANISSITTTTTSSTTSTPAPQRNRVYYGVVSEYMSGTEFRDTALATIMGWDSTDYKTIVGTSVNEFEVPQNGYIQYIIVPTDLVELQYAAFTSGGITTVYYDYTKQSIAGQTENGAYYSKYTRGGANANPGGTYNGINYDVFFFYNNAGGTPELVTIKAKNK